MLCQFSVRNFKSIQDEITFDLQAVAISEHEDKIIVDCDGEQYLPVSVVYGPNGGGKSNVLQAIQTLVHKVIRPIYAANDNILSSSILSGITVEPYAFSEQGKNSPTDFEIFFRTEIAEYRYVLSVQNDIILYESLDRIRLHVQRKRKTTLIHRENGRIEVKSDFARLKISDGLSENIPVLSYLGITYSNNETIKDVLNWFTDKIQFINYSDPIRETYLKVANSAKTKKLVLKMLQEMDLEIDDFRIEKDGGKVKEVYIKHILGGVGTELRLQDESSGTQKLFGMIPDIINSLKLGSTLVIDELDAKIHPVLLRHIISLYTDLNVNRRGAQLVFTSHDLSTMNNEVFRRDEIWFVAKGDQQNSVLYSLVEFKDTEGKTIRKDAKYDKQYLEGKYGADPYLRRIVDWGSIDAES